MKLYKHKNDGRHIVVANPTTCSGMRDTIEEAFATYDRITPINSEALFNYLEHNADFVVEASSYEEFKTKYPEYFI